MAHWEKLFEQAPKIIAEAAKSERGIVALIILALSALGAFFFGESSDLIKLAAFLMLVVSFGLFAVAITRTLQQRRGELIVADQPAEQETTPTPESSAAEVLLPDATQPVEAKEWPAIAHDSVSTASLPITGEHLFGREQELERLDHTWVDEGTNVISLVAWGGVGKSALVNHWLGSMAKENYWGAKRVYGVSFYSQGTRETATSADIAVDAALRWFGDPDPTMGSPWDKGERLAG